MKGSVTSGKNHSAGFIPIVSDIVFDTLGFHPFPGTLNLDGVDGVDALPEQVIEDPSLGMDNCRGLTLRPCSVGGVRAGIIRPLVEGYPEDKVEIVAPIGLRTLFGIADGDRLSIADTDDLAASDRLRVDAMALDEFDSAVFDLDNTLVELAVEWEDVRGDLVDLLGGHLSEPLREDMEVSLQELSREHGLWEEFAETVAEYEIIGAKDGTQLPLLDIVPALDCPVGVCTRNSTAAAEHVLERFGVRDAVDVIVARETVREQKPHPKPLEHCLNELDTAPGDAIFVGDDPTDLEAATEAGTSFLYPERIDAPR